MARKGLFATLEDMDNNAISVDQGEVVPEVVAEVAEGSAELTADGAEVNDLVAQVEDAVEADGQLTDLVEPMQDSVDAGTGLDETAADIAEVAVESIMSKLGYKGGRYMPATENFGSANSRVSSTRIAIEGVMDKIKEIWKGILNFLKMVWQKITDFFAKFFNNSDKLEKAAKEVQAEISKISTKTMTSKTFESNSVAKAFNVKGKTGFESLEHILKNHKAAISGTAKVFEASGKLTDYVGSNTGNAEKIKSFDIEKAKDVLRDIFQNADLGVTGNSKAGKLGKKDTEVLTFGPFVDGREVKVTSVYGTDKKIESLGIEYTEAETEKLKSEVPTLTIDQMKATCANIVEMAKGVTEFKKDQDKIKKIGAELEKAVSNIISAVGSVADEEPALREKLEAIKTATKSVTSVVSRYSTMVPSMNVRAGNAALGYVRLSIKQYGDKKKD